MIHTSQQVQIIQINLALKNQAEKGSGEHEVQIIQINLALKNPLYSFKLKSLFK